MADGGEIMKHKHNEHITIQLIEPTNKGWKVKQIETHSISGKKLSTPKEKVAYFSKDEIKELFQPMMADGGEISDNFYKTIGAKSKNDFFDTIYGNRQLYDKVERKLNVDRMNKLINYKDPLFSDTMSVLFSLYYSKDENHTQTKGGKTRKAFFEDAIEILYGKMAMGGEMMQDGGEIIFYQDFRPRERKFKIGELVFFEADIIKNVEAKVLAKVDEKKVKIEILESYTLSKNVRISGDEKADISLMTKVGLGKESLIFEKGKEVKIGTIKVVNQEKINPLKGYTPLNYVPKSKEFSDIMKMAMGGETTFDDKVKAVKSSLLKRKKVSPKVQKDYGKTYSPKEAEESAKRIVGSQTAKWKQKFGKK
jgi:hypothetical protein